MFYGFVGLYLLYISFKWLYEFMLITIKNIFSTLLYIVYIVINFVLDSFFLLLGFHSFFFVDMFLFVFFSVDVDFVDGFLMATNIFKCIMDLFICILLYFGFLLYPSSKGYDLLI